MAITATQAREVAQEEQQTRIVSTGRIQTWLDARLAMDKEGKRMPTNADYDKISVGSEKWREISRVFPAWTDSVLIYPAKNGKFNAGKDAVDACKDRAKNEWVFSAASIPKEAIGKEGVGIHIDHPAIEVRGKTVILSAGPESTVTVLEDFIQESGKAGKVDEKTRVPLAVSNADNLPAGQIRWLYRVDTAGVRPLVRGFYACNWWYTRLVVSGDGREGFGVPEFEACRRDVSADYSRDDCLGVAQLETGSEAAAPKTGTANPQLAPMAREILPQIIEALEENLLHVATPEIIENLKRLQRVASEDLVQ
jgi:hypothetical protein